MTHVENGVCVASTGVAAGSADALRRRHGYFFSVDKSFECERANAEARCSKELRRGSATNGGEEEYVGDVKEAVKMYRVLYRKGHVRQRRAETPSLFATLRNASLPRTL